MHRQEAENMLKLKNQFHDVLQKKTAACLNPPPFLRLCLASRFWETARSLGRDCEENIIVQFITVNVCERLAESDRWLTCTLRAPGVSSPAQGQCMAHESRMRALWTQVEDREILWPNECVSQGNAVSKHVSKCGSISAFPDSSCGCHKGVHFSYFKLKMSYTRHQLTGCSPLALLRHKSLSIFLFTYLTFKGKNPQTQKFCHHLLTMYDFLSSV